MKITSPAFESNQTIPSKYTCDGENINPPLQFKDIPGNTKSLALIVDDPDAPIGNFVHWVVFNIPPSITEVQENSDITNGVYGANGTGKTGFIGACPPNGQHRYFFKLYALDTMLDLQERANKQEVESAMKGHVISSSELVGLYSRQN